MTEPSMDRERLAALIDGRLGERERDEVLARLAASEDELEVFADAVAVTAELEAEDGPPAVIPLRPESARRWPAARWRLLAAVLAAVALAPLLWSRLRAPDADDPGALAALLAARDAGLPTAEWVGSPPWGATRSGGDPNLAEEARAARLGVLLLDLEVAAGARDDSAVVRLAGKIRYNLQQVPASGPTSAIYREIEDQPGQPSEELLERGREGVVGLVDEEMLGLGAWTEAARIAAARRDAGFFRSRATRAALDRAAERTAGNEPARAAVERIRAAVGDAETLDWPLLQQQSEALLREIGR